MGIAVPAASAVEQMAVHRRPVVETQPTGPAALAYAELWAHLRRLL